MFDKYDILPLILWVVMIVGLFWLWVTPFTMLPKAEPTVEPGVVTTFENVPDPIQGSNLKVQGR